MSLPQEVEDALSDMTLSMIYAPGVPNDITAVQLAATWLSSLDSNVTTYNGYQIIDYVRNATENATLAVDEAKDILGKFAFMKSDVWPHGTKALWILLLIASTVTFGLRLYARRYYMGGLKNDDYLLIGAWIVAMQNSCEDLFLMFAQHWDHHAWNATRNMISLHFYIGTIDDLLFPISTLLYKSALIVFFHDLYHAKPFRFLCYFVELLVVAFSIWNTVWIVSMCHPFNNWDNPFIQVCQSNTLMMFKGITLLNVCNDFMILLLPIIVTYNLKMALKKKFAVVCLMGLSTVVCVAGIMRYTTLKYWITTHDVLWRSIPVTTWSLVELHLAIVCASIPAVWKLYNRTMAAKVAEFFRRPSAASSEGPQPFAGGTIKTMFRSFGKLGQKKPVGELTRIMNMRTGTKDLESGVHGTVIGYRGDSSGQDSSDAGSKSNEKKALEITSVDSE